MVSEVPWVASFASSRGLRYEPEADERWFRAWEPFRTMKVPLRYAHALHATGPLGSLSIARMYLPDPAAAAPPAEEGAGFAAAELGSWIAIAQDPRIRHRVAATNDPRGPFAESPEQIPWRRVSSGHAPFDAAFGVFVPPRDDPAPVDHAVLRSDLASLVMSWRIPLHFELRPGGFVLAPTQLRADAPSLRWLVEILPFFGACAGARAG